MLTDLNRNWDFGNTNKISQWENMNVPVYKFDDVFCISHLNIVNIVYKLLLYCIVS